MDGGADPLVRVATRPGRVPGSVPGVSIRDPAASRRVGEGGDRGETGLRAAFGPPSGRDGVLPAGRVASAPRRVRRGRDRLSPGRPVGTRTAAWGGDAAAGSRPGRRGGGGDPPRSGRDD